MQKMKQFNEVLGPASWLFLYAGFVPSLFVLFHPSWKEFLVFLAADFAGLFLTFAVDRRLFLKLFPDSRLYFPELHLENLPQGKDGTTQEQRARLFQSLIRFPARRASYCTAVSILKDLGAALVVTFYWKHESSDLIQFATIEAIFLLSYAFFYGAVFIENHDLVSRWIADIHRHQNWSSVFKRAEIPRSRRAFGIAESVSLLAIVATAMFLELVLTRSNLSPHRLMLELLWVAIAASILFGRVWYLGRQFFIGGLEQLFQAFERFSPRSDSTLAYHSSPVLARFEGIVNALQERIGQYEAELSRWVFQKTDESRYRAMGEAAALVVHDLSAPLHVMQFCAQQMSENPERAGDTRYVDQLKTQSDRSLQLIDSLKAYLKCPKEGRERAQLGTVMSHVLALLRTRFRDLGIDRIRIEVADEVNALSLRFPERDLIHVALNLLGNSVENLIQNQITSPFIRVCVLERSVEQVTLGFEDNGTGLSPERFEQMTGPLFQQRDTMFQEGLGLRLVRRLTEKHEGSLRALQVESGHGTRIALRARLDQVGMPGLLLVPSARDESGVQPTLNP